MGEREKVWVGAKLIKLCPQWHTRSRKGSAHPDLGTLSLNPMIGSLRRPSKLRIKSSVSSLFQTGFTTGKETSVSLSRKEGNLFSRMVNCLLKKNGIGGN